MDAGVTGDIAAAAQTIANSLDNNSNEESGMLVMRKHCNKNKETDKWTARQHQVFK